MRLTAPQALALHVYEMSIERDAESLDYATISELHHPEYLTEDDLRRLFEVDADSAASEQHVDAIVDAFRARG
jgi:hypothetical protein